MYYIVIIDDDLSVQRELKLLLENAGYRADVAEDFANIPEYVQKLQPDLLLLDVALPGADGNTDDIGCPYYFYYFTKFLFRRIRMYDDGWRRFYRETLPSCSITGTHSRNIAESFWKITE